MSLRTILSLKRAALQSRIDALAAQEAGLLSRLSDLAKQGDGLGAGQTGSREAGSGEAGAAFQIAAQTLERARTLSARLDTERLSLAAQRDALAREKLALDIADARLEAEAGKAARQEASRAADRV
ncbi:MAG: hypothetical protein WBG08_01045 [Litorimonas sp.]